MSRVDPNAPVADRRLFIGLLVLIAWLPLPFGSNHPWAWGIMEIWAFGLLTLWCFVQGRQSVPIPDLVGPHRGLILLLVLWLAYYLLQAMPLPLEIINYLSPAAYHVYTYALAGSEDRLYTLSLDPGLTLQIFLKSAAYVTIFVLVLALTHTRARARQLVYVMIIVAFTEAVWAFMTLKLAGPSQIRSTTGTFVNSNHFAALLGIGIPLTLGILIGLAGRARYVANWRMRLYSLLDLLLLGKMRLFLYLAVVVMLAALLFSTSRGAVFSLLFAVVVGLLLVVMLRGRRSREVRLWPVVAVAVIGVLSWIGSGALSRELETRGLQDPVRQFVRISSYQMIQDYPLVGIGSGNWAFLYPMYKDPQQFSHLVTSHAHNDYLELMAEQGVIGFGLIGCVVMLALLKMVIGLKQRRDPLMRGILFACLVAILSLLAHAWVEFHFHIPAIAAWFFVLMALGLVASRLHQRELHD